MSLRAGQHKLRDAYGVLTAHWQRTHDVWDDQAAQRFGEDVVAPLDPAVRDTLAAMSQMHELVVQARSACS